MEQTTTIIKDKISVRHEKIKVKKLWCKGTWIIKAINYL